MTWPSVFPVGTRGYMKDRIDDELKRSGTLGNRIEQAINDAIAVYQGHRFRFSESRDVLQFNTVTGQEFYTAADAPAIATLQKFDYVVVTIGTTRFDLTRVPPEEIELGSISGTQQGQPEIFSYYNEQIRFYPVPSDVFPIIVAGHMRIAAPAGDAEVGNRWMTDGERLIRCRAKRELAVHNLKDIDLAAAMGTEDGNGEVAEAYYQLKRVTNLVTATGRLRPTQF